MILRPPRSTRPDTLCPYTTLFRSEQLAQPLAVDAGVVARDGEVLDPRIADRVDQPLGNAAQAETARADLHPVEEEAVAGCGCVGVSLVRHESASCLRSEERRVGKECGRTCSTRWVQVH